MAGPLFVGVLPTFATSVSSDEDPLSAMYWVATAEVYWPHLLLVDVNDPRHNVAGDRLLVGSAG